MSISVSPGGATGHSFTTGLRRHASVACADPSSHLGLQSFNNLPLLSKTRTRHLGAPAATIRFLDRALAQFEDFCVVTQSVRAAIPARQGRAYRVWASFRTQSEVGWRCDARSARAGSERMVRQGGGKKRPSLSSLLRPGLRTGAASATRKASEDIRANCLASVESKGPTHQFEVRIFGEGLDRKAQPLHELQHVGVVAQHQPIDLREALVAGHIDDRLQQA